jgi:hypothetical protein
MVHGWYTDISFFVLKCKTRRREPTETKKPSLGDSGGSYALLPRGCLTAIDQTLHGRQLRKGWPAELRNGRSLGTLRQSSSPPEGDPVRLRTQAKDCLEQANKARNAVDMHGCSWPKISSNSRQPWSNQGAPDNSPLGRRDASTRVFGRARRWQPVIACTFRR